jgi:uncharacterized protein with FMN-binding domain
MHWYTVLMRKYTLGIIIAIVFVAYSMVLRHQHSEPVIAPAALSQNNSAGPTTTTPSTSTTPTTPPVTTTTPSSQYKDGTYTGSVENAFYGNVQVSATITSGKITTVNFLESPNDNPNSIYVNSSAMPYLKQEAIKAQSSKVSIVTGATFTSQAFQQSLSNALSQAM